MRRRLTVPCVAALVASLGKGSLAGSGVRAGALTLIDQAIISGTNFVTMIVVARAAGATEVGLYALGFTVTAFALCFQGGLITSPYMVLGNRVEGQARRVLAGSSLVQQAAFAALAVLAMGVLALLGAAGYLPDGFAVVAWVLAAVIPLILLREFLRRVALAHLELRRVVALDASVAVLQLAGLWILAALERLSAVSAFWVVGGACAMAAIVVLASMRRRFAPDLGSLAGDLRENWSLGKWGVASQVALLVSSSSLYWMIALRHGTEMSGIFATCMSIPMLANPLIVGASNFVAPKCARTFAMDGSERLSAFVGRTTVALGSGLLLIALAVAVSGDRLVVALYGAAYGGYGLGIGLQSFGMAAMAMAIPAGSGLWAMAELRSNFAANLVGLIVALAAGLAAVGPYGVTGAATAFLLSSASMAVAKHLAFRRRYLDLVANEVSTAPAVGGRALEVGS